MQTDCAVFDRITSASYSSGVTTVQVDKSRNWYGAAPSYTWNIDSFSGLDSATVAIYTSSGTYLASATTNSSGTATINYTLSAGTYVIFFEYNDFTGDQEFVSLTKDLTIEFKFKKASAPASVYTVHLTHSDIPEDVLAEHYDPDPDCNLTDGYTYDIADPSLPVYCLDGYYGEEGLINSYVIDKILINDTECPIPSDDGDDIAKNDIDGIEGAVHFVRDEAGLL